MTIVVGCSSSVDAEEPTPTTPTAAETSSTEVVISGTGGSPADSGIDDPAVDGSVDATGAGSPEGAGQADDASATDGDAATADDSVASGDATGGAGGSTNGSTNPPAAPDGETQGTDGTTSTTPAANPTICTGAAPGWPAQSTLNGVDLDGDGLDEVIATHSDPRDETVLGITWGNGGWSAVDVGALPDDGDSEVVGAPDLDGDGRSEIVVTSPGPLPDTLIQIARVDGCSLRFLRDSRTGEIFETVTFARFDSFAGVTCVDGGVRLVFGSLSGDDGAYRLSRSDAALLGETLVFDDPTVDVQPVDDIGGLAPLVGCDVT